MGIGEIATLIPEKFIKPGAHAFDVTKRTGNPTPQAIFVIMTDECREA
jgi:hypothetical protein